VAAVVPVPCRAQALQMMSQARELQAPSRWAAADTLLPSPAAAEYWHWLAERFRYSEPRLRQARR
jgi:hypothetical protein